MTSDIGAILDVKKRFEHIWCITPKSKRDQNLDTISKFGRRELISLDKKKIGGGVTVRFTLYKPRRPFDVKGYVSGRP